MIPPLCPLLPPPLAQMSYRDLQPSRAAPSTQGYHTALQYGHYLWLNQRPARAILALIRALNMPLRDHSTGHLQLDYPLPYAAIAWICTNHHPQFGFLGNPRISFQHQADRLSGPHSDIRRTRAWANWFLISQCRPDLPPDPLHHPNFPSLQQILTDLDRFGIPNESTTFRQALR